MAVLASRRPRCRTRLAQLGLSALLCCVAASTTAAASAPALRVSSRGIEVRLTEAETLLLAVPGLQTRPNDHTGERPSVTVEGDGAVLARYPSGARVNVALAGNTVRYRATALPERARALVIMMRVPAGYKLGGGYRIDEQPLQRFPDQAEKQILWQGRAKSIGLQTPTGASLELQVPSTFQQLQDGRTFGGTSYLYVCYLALPPGQASATFSVRLELRSEADKPAPQAARTQSESFVVDRYGQRAQRSYPEKVARERELRDDAKRERKRPPRYDGPPLDRFGGLAGTRERFGLERSGFFRVADVAGRKVLVTPEGNAFFQLGLCGINLTDDYTLVSGREELYEWLPPRSGEFASAFRPGVTGVFSFYAANWIRKYGEPFDIDAWSRQVIQRMRAWGFNSAGAFSTRTQAMHELSLPTVGMLPLGREHGFTMLPEKLGGGELIDPFADDVEQRLDRAFARRVAPKSSDPLIIGYFLGNEQQFEALPRVIPRLDGRSSAAKRAFVASLRERYPDIASFNAAWRPARPFEGFDQLDEAVLEATTEPAFKDVHAFYRRFLERYFGSIERVFRRHDAHHLLLGARLTPATANDPDVLSISGRHVDVVSVNYYAYGIETDFLRRVHAQSGGRPLLLSEWYYGSTERGLGGGKEVRDQSERARGYRHYVEHAAALPFVVGSQWFSYGDQAITGRFYSGYYGEGNNTGIVSVTDRPYAPLVAATRASGARIYDVMFGKAKPYVFDDPRFTGGKGKGTRVVSIPRVVAPLALDGTLRGWPERPAEEIDASRVVVGNRDPELSGAFRVCWDEHALYVSVHVRDATPGKNRRDARSLWSGDAVELFVGARELDRDGLPTSMDRQVLIGVGEETRVHVKDHPALAADVRAVAVTDVSRRGYVVQARVPWRSLAMQPEAGKELRFDVAIDNSDDGVARKQQLVWNGSARNASDRGAWGRARLVEN